MKYQAMPGIVEHRFNQLQEIEAILNYLNIELRRLRSSYFKKYLENYQRALSSRDVEKYVDGEADVVDYEKIINEFALLRNKWLGVLKALDQKQWQITNVVKLRVAGMEDASKRLNLLLELIPRLFILSMHGGFPRNQGRSQAYLEYGSRISIFYFLPDGRVNRV